MQLPGIYVEIKGDYTELEKNLKAAKALVTSQATQISNSINNALSPSVARGGLDALVKNLSQLDRASKVAGQGFTGLNTGLNELKKMAALTEEQWSRIQEKFISNKVSTSQEQALKRIATAAGLTGKEIQELGRQFKLSEAQINSVVSSIRSASIQAKSFADIAAGLPITNTVSPQLQGIQSGLLRSMGAEAESFAANLTALTNSARAADNVFDSLGSQLDELRKHTKMTDDQFEELQKRMRAAARTNAQVNALRNLSRQLDLTEDEVRQLGEQFGLSAAQMEKIVGSAKRADAAVSNIGTKGAQRIDILSGSVAMLAGKFLLLEQAAYSVQRILNATVFDFSATVETASIGIASAFLNNGQYVDQITGKVLTGQASMNAAMNEADEIINQLRASNLVTIATLDQLIKAYQEAAPVALNKGFNKSQVEQFTVAMMQAAGAVDTTGMLIGQMGEEMRSLLNGGINPKNTRIATALGITNADIASYEGNVQGLFEFIMSKLSAYQAFGDQLQKTWSGVASNTIDILKQVSSQATEPIFVAVRDGLYEMTSGIATLAEKTDDLGNKTRVIEWSPGYLDGLEYVKKEIGDVVDAIGRHKYDFEKAFDGLRDGADGAWRAIKETSGALETVYDWGNKILGLGVFDWGVVGYVLLHSGPQAAALTAALVTINAQLKEYGNNIGALPGKYADMMNSWGTLGQAADDVLSGKRDANTGDLLGVGKTEQAIDRLQRLLDKLKSQRDFSAQNPFISGLFGQGDVEKINSDISKVESAIENLKKTAAESGDIKWQQKITISADEREKLEKEIKDREEAFKRGREAAEKYIQTRREAIIADFKDISKYLVPGSDEMKKAEAKRDSLLADLNEQEIRAKSAASAKAERAELKELSATIKGYTAAAKEAADIGQEWNRSTTRTIEEMVRLNDEVTMSGLGEYGSAVYQMARQIEEGGSVIDDFNARISEAQENMENTKSWYDSVGEQLAMAQSALGANSAGSDSEDANKVRALAAEYQRLREILEEQKFLFESLNALKKTGRVTSKEQLEEEAKSQAKYTAQLSFFNETGYATADMFDNMVEHARAEALNYLSLTDDKIGATKKFQTALDDLRLNSPDTSWEDAIGIGFRRVADSGKTMADDISNAIEDAFSQATDDLTDFILKGESGFEALSNLAEDFLNIFIQSQIMGPLAGALGESLGLASLFHTGGSPDAGEGQIRFINPRLWDNAPRYHSGLLPGEARAIIKTDETIFTKGQMKALGQSISQAKNSGGNTLSANANISIYGPTSKKIMAEMRTEMERVALEVLKRNM